MNGNGCHEVRASRDELEPNFFSNMIDGFPVRLGCVSGTSDSNMSILWEGKGIRGLATCHLYLLIMTDISLAVFNGFNTLVWKDIAAIISGSIE